MYETDEDNAEQRLGCGEEHECDGANGDALIESQ